MAHIRWGGPRRRERHFAIEPPVLRPTATVEEDDRQLNSDKGSIVHVKAEWSATFAQGPGAEAPRVGHRSQ